MADSVSGQFHQIRFDESGRRLLWNPAKKQRFLYRPEEVVRLQAIDFLHFNCGYPLSRISTEPSVRFKGRDRSLRADVIAYNKKMEPEILVECKAPDVKLDESAALQAARYNSVIGASLVLLTNGGSDFLFRSSESGIKRLPFSEIIKTENPERNRQYWKDRGFPDSNNQLVQFLMNALYTQDKQPVFLYIPESVNSYDLSHYYTQLHGNSTNKIAAALSADHQGRNWLTFLVISENTKNVVLSVSLDYFSVWLNGEKNDQIMNFENLIKSDDVPFALYQAADEIINKSLR
jgi:hypothetical protein